MLEIGFKGIVLQVKSRSDLAIHVQEVLARGKSKSRYLYIRTHQLWPLKMTRYLNVSFKSGQPARDPDGKLNLRSSYDLKNHLKHGVTVWIINA